MVVRGAEYPSALAGLNPLVSCLSGITEKIQLFPREDPRIRDASDVSAVTACSQARGSQRERHPGEYQAGQVIAGR